MSIAAENSPASGITIDSPGQKRTARILLLIPLAFVLVAGTISAIVATSKLHSDQTGYFSWGYAFVTTGVPDPGPVLLKMSPEAFGTFQINGRRQAINKYPIGWSLLTLPGMASGRAVAMLLHLPADDPRTLEFINNGARLAAVAWALAGLICAFHFLSRMVSQISAAWAVLLIWLGTSAFGYTWRDLNMSHVISLATVAIAYAAAARSFTSPRPGRWSAIFGLACGLVCCTRLINLILVLPAFLLLAVDLDDPSLRKGLLWKLSWTNRPRLRTALLGAIAMLAALPPLVLQAGIWKYLYGFWFFNGYGFAKESFQLPIYALKALFSSRHGLFFWHPITLLATIGLLLESRTAGPARVSTIFVRACLVAVAIMILLYGSWRLWWLGWSFGARWATDSFVLWALGLSIFIERAMLRRSRWLIAAMSLLALLSAGLIVAQMIGLIGMDQFLQVYLPRQGWYVLP